MSFLLVYEFLSVAFKFMSLKMWGDSALIPKPIPNYSDQGNERHQ